MTVKPLKNLGRGIPLLDFAALFEIGRGSRYRLNDTGGHIEEEASIYVPRGKTVLKFKIGDGTCEAIGGKLYAPIGYLSRQLGFNIEIDPQNRYLRVITPKNKTTKEEFLEKHQAFLDALSLKKAIENKEVQLGVLAVNDLLMENTHTLLIAGNTYVPLRETVSKLGGRITPESPSEGVPPRRVTGDRGSFELKTAPLEPETFPPPPGLRGFTLNAAQPLVSRCGKTFIQARFLEKAFKIEISDIQPEISGKEFHATRLVNREEVKTTRSLFSAGPQWDRAAASLQKSERQLFKTAYLTFDDGPSRSVTPRILDILKTQGVRATFFVLGKEAAARPELLKRIRDEGHVVANHTYSHRKEIIYRDVEGLMGEIRRTDDLFQEILGERSKMFRAPYGVWGNLKTEHYKQLHDAGYKIYNWNVDPGDSAGRTVKAATIVENFRKQIENKTEALILFHDSASKQETVKALPEVIKLLREKNFEILPLNYSTEIQTKGVVQ